MTSPETLPRLDWTLAAPSFVLPGTVAENCRFLEGKVREVGITLFETKACLDYTREDLPPDLAGLDLDYHVHLPLDLPWSEGADHVWELVAALLNKTVYLNPKSFVLHPPKSPTLFANFIFHWLEAGFEPSRLFLENTPENDLVSQARSMAAYGCRFCLDLGHLLAHGQHDLLRQPGVAGNIGMLHLYSPGPEKDSHRHESLGFLDDTGKQVLQSLLSLIPGDCVLMLEVFDWKGVLESGRVLASWLNEWEEMV